MGDGPVGAEQTFPRDDPGPGGGPAVARAVTRIGRPGSRSLLPTPALVCDVDLLVANIDRLASQAAAAGVAVRPHVKTHKSAFVARLQLQRGAVGLSCAKVAEAEAVTGRLVAEGWPTTVSVLITSPTAGREAAERVAALSRRCHLLVAVDHPDGVDELAAALTGSDRVGVVCDVDLGMGRTGVTGPGPACAVADRVARHRSLHFAGVQGYAGHVQHTPGRAARLTATTDGERRLSTVVDALTATGHDVTLRSGGGTGTSAIDLELGVLTELQCGSYVFMDREYRDALGDDPDGRFAHSLTIATTVVSANQPRFVTVDAGLKAMATDAGPAAVVAAGPGVDYHFFGDEHGMVTTGGGPRFVRGDRIDLVPPHCDPTVDRYDRMWLVRGDTVVGVAAVDGRGRSQ